MRGSVAYDVISSVVFFVALVVAMCFFSSCGTTREYGNDTELVIANQRAIQRIETVSAELGRLHASSTNEVERIRSEVGRLRNSIDRLEHLFGQYDREVSRLLAEIDRIRERINGEREMDSPVTGDNNN